MTTQPAHVRRAQSIKRRVVRRPYADIDRKAWWVIDADGTTYPFTTWESAVRAAIREPLRSYVRDRMAP